MSKIIFNEYPLVNPSWSCAVEVSKVGCRRLKCRYEISGLGECLIN
ncbi:hypothetical protein ACMGD3_22605 [Lysinibacillus sphaericus]